MCIRGGFMITLRTEEQKIVLLQAITHYEEELRLSTERSALNLAEDEAEGGTEYWVEKIKELAKDRKDLKDIKNQVEATEVALGPTVVEDAEY